MQIEKRQNGERRQRRSDDTMTALHYQLSTVRRDGGLEALVLADPRKIAPQFEKNEADRAIRNLMSLAQSTPPEKIDDGEQTAPSERIIQELPEYAGAKSSAGSQIVMAIGLPQIRRKCPHFDQWVRQLEALGAKNEHGPAKSR